MPFPIHNPLLRPPAPTPLVYASFLPVGYAPPGEHARMIEETSRQYLAVIEDAARSAGVECAVAHTTNDFPVDAILEAVHRCGCDGIFMASHERRARKGSDAGERDLQGGEPVHGAGGRLPRRSCEVLNDAPAEFRTPSQRCWLVRAGARGDAAR
jgi:hypothetical protein